VAKERPGIRPNPAEVRRLAPRNFLLEKEELLMVKVLGFDFQLNRRNKLAFLTWEGKYLAGYLTNFLQHLMRGEYGFENESGLELFFLFL
jgi:hypothetical protein